MNPQNVEVWMDLEALSNHVLENCPDNMPWQTRCHHLAIIIRDHQARGLVRVQEGRPQVQGADVWRVCVL